MDYIDSMISERLGGINFGKGSKSYKFAVIKEAKKQQMNQRKKKGFRKVGNISNLLISKHKDIDFCYQI